MKQAHPSDAILKAFGQGRLSPDEADRLAQHVESCGPCEAKLAAVGEDSFIELLRATESDLLPTPPARTPVSEDVPAELRSHPRYEILKRVGCGGMGVVYQAQHRMMDRSVALKIIRRDLMATPAAVSRFRREVHAAGKLSHPNIVTAFDAEEVSGLHFLVMEFVEGRSLDQVIEEKGPLAAALACGIIRQAAVGLQHAHERGMIHRDIKPQNLMLTRTGKVKILDFGLARSRGPAESGEAVRITRTNAALGTPFFLAPEQIKSAAEVDHRADLYSLGATLYYLLTGEPPVPPSGQPEAMPPLPGMVPAAVGQIVMKLLSPAPEDRYGSAREVAVALAPWVGSKSSPNARDFKRWRGPLIVAAGAAALGGIFLIGWWSTRDPGGEKAPTRLAAAGASRSMPSQPERDSPRPVRASSSGQPEDRPAPPKTAAVTELQVVFLLPTKGLWYEDYAPAREALEQRGIRVIVATPGGVPSELHEASMQQSGQRPGAVKADVDLMTMKAEPYAAFLCVGYVLGELTDSRLPTGKKTRALLADAVAGEKWIVGICVGQNVLGATEVVRGKMVAARSQYVADLEKVGAKIQPDTLMIDGHVITATAPENSRAAGNLLADQLLPK